MRGLHTVFNSSQECAIWRALIRPTGQLKLFVKKSIQSLSKTCHSLAFFPFTFNSFRYIDDALSSLVTLCIYPIEL